MALYTEDQKSHFKRVSQETVDLLNSLGYKAKVGTQQGLSYPAVREGAWTLAMLWDDGKGWSCPGYSKFPGPHWHWFLSSNFASNFIHVHHTTPVSKLGPGYIVNPIKDLVPLCPNCHAAVHLSNPPIDPLILKELIDKREIED